MRRALLPLLVLALLLTACRNDRKPVALTPESDALLRKKADEKIGLIIRRNLPALFAGLVVFRSDAFLYQSARLDRDNLPVLDAFGNAAIVLLNAPDIPLLLQEDSVKKVYYYCRQAVLPRIHPTLELDILRRFGEGKEQDPVTLLVRFREPPQERDAKTLEAAGFTVGERGTMTWAVKGPATAFPRLLENDGIIFVESASN
ncbi:MAG: hypothetical protein M1550_05355 [Deltaproteobacteria bacterium]|nr:hypothetical protein [Deltaproteobacteria bacterium]